MTRFNTYAKQLDEAFKGARSAYQEEFNKLEALRQQLQKEHDPNRRIVRQAELTAGEEAFRTNSRHIWEGFDNKCAELRTALNTDVKKHSLAASEDIDMGALELMKAGVLTTEDYSNFAEKYDGNATMLKLIAHYAGEAAAQTQNRKSAAALHALASNCATGMGKIINSWNELEVTANYCSGRGASGAKSTTPEFVLAMGKRWEEASGEAVASF